MAGILEDLVDISLFNNFSGVHDNNIICDFGDHTKVMGNEDNGSAFFLLQIFH